MYPQNPDRRCKFGDVDSLPETFNGLPLHPLVVHVAVVLVPLSGLLALLMVFIPRFSARFGPLIALIAWLGVGAGFVAKESGEMLQEATQRAPALHVESGDLFPAFAIAQAVLILLLWVADRRGGRGLFGILIALLTLVAVAVTGYWTYRTGDSGAQAVWSNQLPA